MRLKDQIMLFRTKVSEQLHITAEEEAGDFGIKQLAVTVAVIVIIGFVITFMQENMDEILTQVWDWLFETIQKMVG